MRKILDPFSKALGREKVFPGLHISTEEEMRLMFAIAEKLGCISPRLAAMFSADPHQTLHDMGIDLDENLSKRFEFANRHRKTNPDLYNELLDGKKSVYVAPISFRTSDLNEIALGRKKILEKLKNSKKGTKLNQLEMLYFQLESLKRLTPSIKGPYPLTRRKRKQVGGRISSHNKNAPRLYESPQSWFTTSTTGDHDIVLQIKENFWSGMISTLIQDYWAYMALAILFGAEIPVGSFLPSHTFQGRFFCFDFRVIISLHFDNLPYLKLSDVNYAQAAMNFPCDVSLETRSDSSEPWSTPYLFSGTLSDCGNVNKKDSGSFLGQNLQRFFELDLINGRITLEDRTVDIDPLTELLTLAAAYDMVHLTLQGVPVSPELFDDRPFIYYDEADWSTLQEPLAMFTGESLTITWGPNTTPFAASIVPQGYQMTLGLSRGVFSFYAERNLPDVPIVNGSVHITTMNVEPRWGYIEVWGDGYAETCDCWPNESFTYYVQIGLDIDASGNLTSKVINSYVGLDGFSATLLQILAPFIGSIVVSIAEGIFGEEAAQQVTNSLDMNMNINEMLSGESSFNPVQVSIKTARITPNGLFFDGNLLMTM
jgi:hypothetical protein